jgi:hypothetical protein
MSASEKPHHIDISVTLPLMYSHRLMAQIADPHAERNRAHRRFLELPSCKDDRRRVARDRT